MTHQTTEPSIRRCNDRYVSQTLKQYLFKYIDDEGIYGGISRLLHTQMERAGLMNADWTPANLRMCLAMKGASLPMSGLEEMIAAYIEAHPYYEQKPSKFVAWLIRQESRDTPVGDLAQDIQRDIRFPLTADVEGVRQYIYAMDRDHVTAAFDEAAAEYLEIREPKKVYSFSLRPTSKTRLQSVARDRGMSMSRLLEDLISNL